MPMFGGSTGFRGSLGIQVIRKNPTLRQRIVDAWAAFWRGVIQ